MGDFGKSFKKELGKATGRRVANALYGNKHASKHHVTIQRDREREERRREREAIREEKEYHKEESRKQKEEEKRQREIEREQKRLEIEERKRLRADSKAQKEEEKEYQRWLKEQERLEKEQEKENNIKEAESFQNYVKAIQSIHTIPVDRVDWKSLLINPEKEKTFFVDFYFPEIQRIYETKEGVHKYLNKDIYKEFFTEDAIHLYLMDEDFYLNFPEENQALTGLNPPFNLFGENKISNSRPKDYDDSFLNQVINSQFDWKLKYEEQKEIEQKAIDALTFCDKRVIDTYSDGSPYLRQTGINLKERIEYYETELYGDKTRLERIKNKYKELANKNSVSKLFNKKEIENCISDINKLEKEYIPNITKSINNHTKAYKLINEYLDLDNDISRVARLHSIAKEKLEIWDEAWEQAYLNYKTYKNLDLCAKEVLAKNSDFYEVAINWFPIWEFTTDFGSSLSPTFYENTIDVDFFVNIDGVVPIHKKTSTQAGKITLKPFTDTERNDIIQDYICSSILRITKEAFSVLPIENIYIHAIDKIINSSTGKYEDAILVSVNINKSQFENLNLDFIDPSDAVEGFEYNMQFSKSNGFKPVDKLKFNKTKTNTSPKKPPKEEKKQAPKETDSVKLKSLDTASIRFSASLTVLDIQNQFKELFDKNVIVLTPKGNAAGENRKLRALTDKDLKTEIIVPIEKLTKKALKEVKKITGIHIEY